MVPGPMALSGKVVATVVAEVDSVASQVVSLVLYSSRSARYLQQYLQQQSISKV